MGVRCGSLRRGAAPGRSASPALRAPRAPGGPEGGGRGTSGAQLGSLRN